MTELLFQADACLFQANALMNSHAFRYQLKLFIQLQILFWLEMADTANVNLILEKSFEALNCKEGLKTKQETEPWLRFSLKSQRKK